MARRKELKKEAVKQLHNEHRIHVGVEDMVLLEDIKDIGIVNNLRQRLKAEQIYTYIGNVLVICNPYKWLPIYSDAVMSQYIQMQRVDVSPHIYATAEAAFRSMVLEEDNQCIIISGESGAGKTEASKQIQSYIAKVCSGRGPGTNAAAAAGGIEVEKITRIFLESNPVLEAFGNAKTLRNNNSSRFGKYFELKFDKFGFPTGGVITNYLLEKSRICNPAKGERNFHIFYQLLRSKYRERLSLQSEDASAYGYLAISGCDSVDGVNDTEEFQTTLNAMRSVGLKNSAIRSIFSLLAAILHLGNIDFEPAELKEAEGSKVASSSISTNSLRCVSELLELPLDTVEKALTYRELQTNASGGKVDSYSIPQNTTQARGRRDAIAKALYERIFNLIIERINVALEPGAVLPPEDRSAKVQSISAPDEVDIASAATRADGSNSLINRNKHAPGEDIFDVEMLSIGVLDIYGFEVFEKNHFEQLCINYVNEKLQQIFIELTLNAEQQEYADEGIAWQSIPFFNNKVVCDLLDGLRPSGLFRILDDHCRTMHGAKDSGDIDRKFMETALQNHGSHAHFSHAHTKFTIRHYAGDVVYQVGRLAAANKDALDNDLMVLMRSSNDKLLPYLFPDEEATAEDAAGARKRGTIPSAGARIRNQTGQLVISLMECSPHYVRCIKSNDAKAALTIDESRVKHQVQYLGLAENVKVRRAGFAYRADYHRFLDRFALLTPATYPEWKGADKDGCAEILKAVQSKISSLSNAAEVQYGTSKIFIRTPETYFQLERLREKRFEKFAEIIQRAYRSYRSVRDLVNLQNIIGGLYLDNEKVRRRDSIYCPFLGVSLDGLGKDEVVLEEFRDSMYRVIDYYSTDETVLFVDMFAAQVLKSNSTTGEAEVTLADRVLVLTTAAIYVMERISPAAWADLQKSSGAKQLRPPAGTLFLRRRLDLQSELLRVYVSKLADNCVVLQCKPNSEVANSNNSCGTDPKVDHLHNIKAATSCAVTGAAFGMMTWRYNCRLSGQVVCANASQYKQTLPDLNYFTKTRVCDTLLGLSSSDLLEDLVVLSARKTEFISLIAFQCLKNDTKAAGGDTATLIGRNVKFDKITIVDRVPLRTSSNPAAAAASQLPATEIFFQQQDANISGTAGGGSLSIGSTKTHSILYQRVSGASGGGGSLLNIFTPRGISPEEMVARREAQIQRQKKAAERRKRENEERRQRLLAKQQQREAIRMQKIAERKAKKKAERDARRNRAIAATNALSAATGVSPASSKSNLSNLGGSGKSSKTAAVRQQPPAAAPQNDFAAALAKRKAASESVTAPTPPATAPTAPRGPPPPPPRGPPPPPPSKPPKA